MTTTLASPTAQRLSCAATAGKAPRPLVRMPVVNTLAAPAPRRLPLAQWRRYVSMLLAYATPRKVWNLARIGYHYLAGTTKLPTRPALLKVEISRACEVKCKHCHAEKFEQFFPLERFRALVDELKGDAFLVSLYDVGEPLLNAQVLEYIRHAHAAGLGTVISTSLSVSKPEGFWRELATSGLDRIIVAIDGVTEGVYKQYRTAGDFSLVMANLGALCRARAEAGSPLVIEWQLVDLPWNRHEHEAARALARELGCDTFRVIPEVVRKRLRYEEEGVMRERNCVLPYLVFIADAFGRVRPCYKMYTQDMTVGRLDEQGFEALWNGPDMQAIRDRKLIRRRCVCATCQE